MSGGTFVIVINSTCTENIISETSSEHLVRAWNRNWSDLGIKSWYDFALTIQKIAVQLNFLAVNPIFSYQYPPPAASPNYSAMDTIQSSQVKEQVYRRKVLFNVLSIVQLKK